MGYVVEATSLVEFTEVPPDFGEELFWPAEAVSRVYELVCQCAR
jgi:hypothetical protein